MKMKILGSSGSQFDGLHTTSLLIGDRLLLDAGTGTSTLGVEAIDRIENVLLTHCHLDHTATLCFIADCRIGGKNGHGLRVRCLQETADALREGMLNGKIWPDFEKIVIDGVPLMSFEIFKPFEQLEIDGIRITPLPVEHQVPTSGFCLEGDKGNFLVLIDMDGMPDETLQFINKIPDLHAMTMEVSFPEGMETLAKAAGHLTPLMLGELLDKMPGEVPVYYCHLKPRYHKEIVAQMHARFGDRAVLLEQGMEFEF